MQEIEIINHYEIIKRDTEIIKAIYKKYCTSYYIDMDDIKLTYEWLNDIEKTIDKAILYDIEKLKRSQGGKKSAKNMTKAERIERARKAGSTKKKPNKNRTTSI